MVDEELQPRYENSYALIIGVNSYTDPSFAPLGEAEEDAEILADVLSSEPHNFRVRTILGEQATKRNILQSMYDLRATEPDDRILVYFACHGYTLTDRFGKESGYLAAFDTVPQQDFTALHMEEVLVLRRHAGAKHIAFIFDACFSGQALGLTRAQSVAAEKFLTRRAYQVLSAGAGDQTVSDYNSMTRLLINALTGPMISADGVYTLGDLGQHVQTTMAGDSNQWQIPQFGHVRGSQGGDFVFHYEQGVTLPHEIQTALYSENSHLRWGGVAAIIELLENPHTDPDMLTAARLQLETIAQNDTDERVRRMALHFFQMDDLKAMESTGKLSRREVLAAAESAREEMTEMQEEMQRDTGTDLQAVKDELLDSVTTQDRISSSDVIEALYAEDPNARISRSPDHPDAKPPARDLRQWSSVRSQIDDMLGELEDAYDEEAREAKYEDHNAPTLMRGINLEDLERSLRDDRDDEE